MTAAEQIIDEIRESRRKLSAQCGHDPVKYIALLKEFNEKYAAEVAAYRNSGDKSTEHRSTKTNM